MAKRSKLRLQIYLAREQHRGLERIARERDVGVSQVLAEAVDAYLGRSVTPAVLNDEEFRSDPIWSLPDRARDLSTENAAREHDTFLYGPPFPR